MPGATRSPVRRTRLAALGAAAAATSAAPSDPAANAVDNLTLFDCQGRALASIGLFEDPVTVCQRYDRDDVPRVIPS